MKLIDILNLIPERAEFYVEEYDDQGEMVYAWMITPYDQKRRDSLKCVYDSEVTKLYAGGFSAFGNSTPLVIEIRSTIKRKES